MSIRAGRLRHKVTIQKNESQQDPVTGEEIAGWVDFAKVWASVEPMSTNEVIAAQAVQSEVRARILIRARPGVSSSMRVLHGDVVYAIKGDPLPDKDSGREYLTLMVAAGVNDG